MTAKTHKTTVSEQPPNTGNYIWWCACGHYEFALGGSYKSATAAAKRHRNRAEQKVAR
jgi:ribosomal protein L37AE/L43A